MVPEVRINLNFVVFFSFTTQYLSVTNTNSFTKKRLQISVRN